MLRVVNEDSNGTDKSGVYTKFLSMMFKSGTSVSLFCHPNICDSVLSKYKELLDGGTENIVQVDYVQMMQDSDGEQFLVQGSAVFDMSNVLFLSVEESGENTPIIEE